MYVNSSLPSRGAWIEIASLRTAKLTPAGRSPPGERGLKFYDLGGRKVLGSRSPPGERGLKYVDLQGIIAPLRSLPSGERGLKSALDEGLSVAEVAPLPGSVD